MAVVDDRGTLVASAGIDTGRNGFTELWRMIAELLGSGQTTPIAIEIETGRTCWLWGWPRRGSASIRSTRVR